MSTIASVSAELHRYPLSRPWAPDVRANAVIVLTVCDGDGARGVGFSWTPTIGAEAIRAMLAHDVAPWAVGREVDPRAVWPALWAHLREAGSAGVTSLALAALDIALWDLQGIRSGRSLGEMIGIRRSRVPAYGSGINLHYTDAELGAQLRRWREHGYTACKIKVGRDSIGDDVRRVAAAREILGNDFVLMIDANQRWDLDRATQAARLLEPYGIRWLEEPLDADDLRGHVELAGRTGIPLAAGENIRLRSRFREFADAGAIRFAQPNVVRVGGITPFLEIARDMQERGIVTAPHLLPELSAQLAACLPTPTDVEVVEGGTLTEIGALVSPNPLELRAGTIHLNPSAGTGLRFRPPLDGVRE